MNFSRLAIACAIVSSLSACVVSVPNLKSTTQTTGNGESAPQPAPSSNAPVANPIIQGLAPNPMAVATKSDVMTFTVTAFSPDGAPLDYTWSATKGYLSATKGQLVTWTPQKSDGSLEAGLATIQVLVSNGKGGTASASVNVRIQDDGSAAKQ